MTKLDFSSPRKLCRWAHQEIANFELAHQTFFAENPYQIVTVNHSAPKKAKSVLFRAINIQKPPEDLERAAYRIVSDLRNALDQAAFASAIAIGSSSPKHTNFPFAITEHDFDRRLASPKGLYRGIPIQLHEKLKSFRPFTIDNENSNGNLELCFLNEVANPNKHQITLETTLEPEFLGIQTLMDVNMVTRMQRISDTEYDILEAWPRGPNPIVAFTVPPTIFLKERGAFKGTAAIVLFKEFHKLVETIIDGIESETLKLL